MAQTINPKQRRRGSVAVEMALVLPLFLLLAFGLFEYGRFLLVRNIIDHAAREGARFAVVRAANQDTTSTDILDRVEDQLAGQGRQIHGLALELFKADPETGEKIGEWQDAAFGETIEVRISGNYRAVTASWLFLPTTFPIEARCMMKSEAN